MTELRKVKIIDDNNGPAMIDAETNGLGVISTSHHEVHEGHSFKCEANDLIMAATEIFILAFKTPNTTKISHLEVSFNTLTGGHVDIIEGPTWDVGSGTQRPIFNRRSAAAMDSSTLLEDTTGSFSATDNLVLDPTGLAGGTLLPPDYSFGEKGKIGGDSRDDDEWLLWPNKTYAIRFTSDVAANKAQITLNWYEHTTSN